MLYGSCQQCDNQGPPRGFLETRHGMASGYQHVSHEERCQIEALQEAQTSLHRQFGEIE